MSRKKKEALQGIIYVLPSFILIMAFCIIPIFMSGYFSFTSYNIMTPPKFVGLENYERVFQDGYVADAAKNTLLYVLMTVPAQTILSLVFAAFLAYKMQNKTGGFLRSVMFIPVIASAVTAGTIWRIILNTEGGLLNNILNFFHLDSVNWLGSTKTALISICIVAVWKNVGYFLVIYYAGIMGISKDLYEAAKVDGATSIQQFFKITLPMLKPITYLVVTLGIIWSFQVFDLAYLMTGGGPGRATVTLVMGIYNAAFKQYKMGYAWTPLGVIGLFFILIFAAICIAPFLYMLIMSFTHSTTLMISWGDVNFTDFTNYEHVFGKSGFFRSLMNSVIVVGCSCFFNCVIASMAAYGFEKKHFWGKEFLFKVYMLTLMIPGQVTMIPVFIIMKKLGLLNTYFALVVIILNAFGVFLIRQFMESVPDELLEAAKVDGCPEYKIFINIVIPLIKPVLVSLVVFTFVTSWNDFMWPLVSTTDSSMYTLTVALSLLKTQYQTNYGLILAGATVSFIFPFILYAFLQKQFVEGIALSGVKG